jgi:hypothetical protein
MGRNLKFKRLREDYSLTEMKDMFTVLKNGVNRLEPLLFAYTQHNKVAASLKARVLMTDLRRMLFAFRRTLIHDQNTRFPKKRKVKPEEEQITETEETGTPLC